MNFNIKHDFVDGIQADPINEIESSLNVVERDLIKIWENVFDQSIDMESDFFELGGDSIKAMALISKINRKFGVLLQIEEIFENGNISYQIDRIQNGESSVASTSIQPAPVQEFYPLSSTQQGFFALSLLNPDTVQCNIPIVYRVYGGINLDLCRNSILEIIRRHEILRTSFRIEGSKVVSKVLDKIEFDIIPVKREGKPMRQLIEECVSPFNLKEPPLFRIHAIIDDEDVVRYLVFDSHHIISDLISLNIFLNEFFLLYRGEPLDPLKIQYKDYAYWQQGRMKEVIATQKDFWVDTYKTVPPKIKLPTTTKPVEKSKFNADTYIFEFDNHEIIEAREVCRREKVSQFTFLMSIFYIMLYKISDQKDLVVSLTSHGRNYPEFHDFVGVFVNTLPVRMQVNPDQDFMDFVQEFRTEMPKYFANQDYPYDAVLQHLRANKLLKNEALYNVMFEHHQVDWEDPKLNLVDRPLLEPKCDMAFQVANKMGGEQGEDIIFFVEYNRNLFDRETMELIGRYYSRLVEQLVDNIDLGIADLIDFEDFKNGPYKLQEKFHKIDDRHVL